MKGALKFVTAVAAIGFVYSQTFGAPLIMKATKDTVICCYHAGQADEEANCNIGGLSTQSRVAGGSNYKGAFDFATHGIGAGNALYDWLVANGITPTGAGAKAAIDAGQLKVEFGVAQVGTGLSGKTVTVRTIDCVTDWMEGNGTSKYANFAWTNTGGAATDYNPQQILPSEGAAKGKGWGTAGNAYFTEATYTTASVADLMWGSTSDSYGLATLSSEAVRQLIDEPMNRGVYTNTTGSSSNSYAYTREYSSGAKAPELVFTIVPEPATMCLLALGGLALLRRRA